MWWLWSLGSQADSSFGALGLRGVVWRAESSQNRRGIPKSRFSARTGRMKQNTKSLLLFRRIQRTRALLFPPGRPRALCCSQRSHTLPSRFRGKPCKLLITAMLMPHLYMPSCRPSAKPRANRKPFAAISHRSRHPRLHSWSRNHLRCQLRRRIYITRTRESAMPELLRRAAGVRRELGAACSLCRAGFDAVLPVRLGRRAGVIEKQRIDVVSRNWPSGRICVQG
jgi:hypothetical protein